MHGEKFSGGEGTREKTNLGKKRVSSLSAPENFVHRKMRVGAEGRGGISKGKRLKNPPNGRPVVSRMGCEVGRHYRVEKEKKGGHIHLLGEGALSLGHDIY